MRSEYIANEMLAATVHTLHPEVTAFDIEQARWHAVLAKREVRTALGHGFTCNPQRAHYVRKETILQRVASLFA